MADNVLELVARLDGKFDGFLKDWERLHGRVGKDTNKMQRAFAAWGKGFTRAGEVVSRGSRKVLLGVGVMTGGVTAGVGSVVKAAADFESAFAGVRKTVDASEADFALLRRGIMDMAGELPKSQEELAGIMEIAGQLGVSGVDNLLKFTRTVADLSETTNLTAEEAATELARFLNILGEGPDKIDRYGSAIVELGNNLATTEREIVAMAMRLAGAGKTAGISGDRVLALAAGLSSVGIEAEAGGTAMSKLIIKVAKLGHETDLNNKELVSMAEIAGVTARRFRLMAKESPERAMIKFFEGLNKVREAGGDVFTILEDLDMKEVRLRDATLRAASAHVLMAKALGLSSDAYRENIALSKEAEQRYKTLASQWKKLWNQVKNVLIEIGDPLLGPIADALKDKLVPELEKLGKWVTDHKEEIRVFGEDVVGVLVEKFQALVGWLERNGEELLKNGKTFAEFMLEWGPWIAGLAGLGVVLGPALTAIGSLFNLMSSIAGLEVTANLAGWIGKGVTSAAAGGATGLLGLAGAAGLAAGGVLAVLESLKNLDDTEPGNNFISRFIDQFEWLKKLVDGVFDKLVGMAGLMTGKDASAVGFGDMFEAFKYTNPITAPTKLLERLTGIDVPGLATGGRVTRGGLAVVGERGPEPVLLPRGAQVVRNDGLGMLRGALAGLGGGGGLGGRLGGGGVNIEKVEWVFPGVKRLEDVGSGEIRRFLARVKDIGEMGSAV